MKYPIITVGIVRGRNNQDWFDKALNSISVQVYRSFAEIDLIIIENFDRKKTIGKCYNEIAKQSKGEWVFYLGDDDTITCDYLVSLMSHCFNIINNYKDKEIVQVTSYTTLFGKNRKPEKSTKAPTGIWKKTYLIKHPFNERLKKCIDTEMMKRLNQSSKYYPAIASYHYGYNYRQHDDNVSGNKLDRGDYDSVMPKVKKIEYLKDSEANEISKFLKNICSHIKPVPQIKVDKENEVIGLITRSCNVYQLKDIIKFIKGNSNG